MIIIMLILMTWLLKNVLKLRICCHVSWCKLYLSCCFEAHLLPHQEDLIMMCKLDLKQKHSTVVRITHLLISTHTHTHQNQQIIMQYKGNVISFILVDFCFVIDRIYQKNKNHHRRKYKINVTRELLLFYTSVMYVIQNHSFNFQCSCFKANSTADF